MTKPFAIPATDDEPQVVRATQSLSARVTDRNREVKKGTMEC